MDSEIGQPQPFESYRGAETVNYFDRLSTTQSSDDLVLQKRGATALRTYRRGIEHSLESDESIIFGLKNGTLVVNRIAMSDDINDMRPPTQVPIERGKRGDYLRDIKVIRSGKNMFIVGVNADPQFAEDGEENSIVEAAQEVDKRVSGLLSRQLDRPKVYLIHKPNPESFLAADHERACQDADNFVNIEVEDKGVFDGGRVLEQGVIEEMGHQLTHFYMQDYDIIHGSSFRNDPLWRRLEIRTARYNRLQDLGAPKIIIDSEQDILLRAVVDFMYKKDIILRVIYGSEGKDIYTQGIKEKLEEANYDPTKVDEIARFIEVEELPKAYREAFATLTGAVVASRRSGEAAAEIVQQVDNPDLHFLYRVSGYDTFSSQVLPSFLDHLRDYYAISLSDLANAVGGTNKKNYNFGDFCSTVGVDYQGAIETWKQTVGRK